MKLLISLVQPRFFVPVHGERRHLHFHARLAESMGIPRKRIFEVQNGDILEIGEDGCKVVDKTSGSYVFVDGSGVGDVGPRVLRERDVLAKSGFVTVFIPISKKSRQLAGKPRVVTRGVVYSEQADAVLKGAESALQAALKRSKRSKSAYETNAREALSRYFYQSIRRRPMIVPVVMEV